MPTAEWPPMRKIQSPASGRESRKSQPRSGHFRGKPSRPTLRIAGQAGGRSQASTGRDSWNVINRTRHAARCPVTVDLPFRHWILPDQRLWPLNIALPAVIDGLSAGEGHGRWARSGGGADTRPGPTSVPSGQMEAGHSPSKIPQPRSGRWRRGRLSVTGHSTSTRR